MDLDTARARVLDAAEALFYERGVQAVGMDLIRSASGVSLKRIYQLFPAKEQLVEEFLRVRDARWRRRLAEHVTSAGDAHGPREAILAVFDWLHLWFDEPGYRGCAFINAFGELGTVSPSVAGIAREHKEEFRRYFAGLVAAADRPAPLADQLLLLAEGAITTSAITGSAEPARQARDAARTLLNATESA
ncbi:MAG: TetR/AcrR family transcriptional regulator [Nocardiopsaceae bacterium]|nr:TetR/AcrR family transcriptional regulator [Nocardiopsaceae bacterium]